MTTGEGTYPMATQSEGRAAGGTIRAGDGDTEATTRDEEGRRGDNEMVAGAQMGGSGISRVHLKERRDGRITKVCLRGQSERNEL